jgi:transposase
MARYTPSPSRFEFSHCESCLEKQIKIDKLLNQIEQLKAQLRYRKKKDMQPFGSSTPSAKLPVKANTEEDNRQKQGGAKKGHKGNGRKGVQSEQADERIEQKVSLERCPDCGGLLEHKETDSRHIVDSVQNRAKDVVYQNEVKRCTCCQKRVTVKTPALPRNKYGNTLISTSAIQHYIHGIPLKRIEEMWGDKVVEGTLIKIFHRLGDLWKPALDPLKIEYRQSPVKHADETGWRTDGHGGYSWIFCAEDLTLFEFRDTRSARVAVDVLGTEKIPGVLVVDRYGGYNKVPCSIQYCYAHLLRNLKDLGEEFPENKEMQFFVSALAPLLADAMHLRGQKISDKRYYQKAKKIKSEIEKVINDSGRHHGIQSFQNIFRENAHRLYHWVEDRRVPADNNRAERELRPTVIARKVSFGSQSEQGAKTRSILMTILHTAKKRLKKNQTLETWFKETLDRFSEDIALNPYPLLPPKPS